MPGWDSLPLGGIAQIRDDLLQLVVGRVRFDASLGGDEPFAGWFCGITESRDGGVSWSEVGPDIHLWPEWTELYGTSNPHVRSDGKLIWAVMGTVARDSEWQAGVTLTGPDGGDFEPPVVFAADPAKNFADLDLIRVHGNRFIGVIREMVEKEGWIAFSDDECRTWHGLRKVGFKAANVKLLKLRDGSILCVHRDEDPARRGVSVQHSRDGGVTWRFVGQLYSDLAGEAHPGRPRRLPGPRRAGRWPDRGRAAHVRGCRGSRRSAVPDSARPDLSQTGAATGRTRTYLPSLPG